VLAAVYARGMGVGRGWLLAAVLAVLALIYVLVTGPRSRTERVDGGHAAERTPELPTSEQDSDLASTDAHMARTSRATGSQNAEASSQSKSLESSSVKFVVRVVTQERKPAPGATVWIYDRRGQHRDTAEAGAEGIASVDVPVDTDLRVLARRGELVSRTVDAAATRARPLLEVQLLPTLPAPFVVRDRQGDPIAHAEIMCSFSGPIRGPGTPIEFIFTDERGEVRMLAQQLGRRPYFRIHKQGFRYRYCEVAREELMNDGAEVRLERVATVVGRVVDQAGRGVEGVGVIALETMDISRSDADGWFRVDGLREAGGRVLISPDPPLGEQLLKHGLPRHDRVDVGEIVLRVGMTIRGKVRRLDDGSVSETMLSARDESHSVGSRRAEVDSPAGTFEIRGLREGTYRILAWLPGGTVSAEVESVQAGAEDVEILLRDRPPLRVSLVSKRTGKPAGVLRFVVCVRPLAGGATRVVRHESSRLRRSTGATVSVDLPGTYEVVVEADDHPVQTRIVDVDEDGAEVTIELPE